MPAFRRAEGMARDDRLCIGRSSRPPVRLFAPESGAAGVAADVDGKVLCSSAAGGNDPGGGAPLPELAIFGAGSNTLRPIAIPNPMHATTKMTHAATTRLEIRGSNSRAGGPKVSTGSTSASRDSVALVGIDSAGGGTRAIGGSIGRGAAAGCNRGAGKGCACAISSAELASAAGCSEISEESQFLIWRWASSGRSTNSMPASFFDPLVHAILPLAASFFVDLGN